jgi:hypothetical protein
MAVVAVLITETVLLSWFAMEGCVSAAAPE